MDQDDEQIDDDDNLLELVVASDPHDPGGCLPLMAAVTIIPLAILLLSRL